MKKNIYFLMPGLDIIPVGGYKVIYEMANRLAKDDFDVTIILPCFLSTAKKTSLKHRLGTLYYYTHSIIKQSPCTWFELDDRINRTYIFNDSKIKLKDNSIICATAVETAFVADKIDNNVHCCPV